MTNPTIRTTSQATVSRVHAANTQTALITLNRPAGAVAGDGLVAVIMGSVPVTLSAPAGWALVAGPVDLHPGDIGNNVGRAWVYGRTAAVSDPTSWTWSDTYAPSQHTDNVIGFMACVQDFTTLDQELDNWIGTANPIVVGPMTTARLGTMVFWLVLSEGKETYDTPAGLTKVLEINHSAGAPTVALYTSSQASANLSTGTKSFTASVNNAGFYAGAIMLSLAGPVPPTPTAITPNTGGTGGGTAATLTGTGFSGQTSATLGGNAVTDFVVVDDHTITFTVPAHAAGPVDLVIGGVTLAAGYTYVAPTITSIAPAIGGAGGGEFVTITGVGFSAGMTAEIDGVALTSPAIVSSTTITGYTVAHADGSVDVTVADGGATATLAAGFRYSDVFELDIALAKAGTLGTAKTDTTQLGVLGQWREYGGSTDLWDDTWTPADCNASGFGGGLSAHMKGASLAQIDAMEIEVFYTVEGVNEPQSLLVVMKVDADRLTVTPELYQLPRSGMNIAHDPNIDTASDGATFYSNRYYRPSRNIDKFWRNSEFWLEIEPKTNVAGFQLWAGIDEAAPFQLNDAQGDPATLLTDGQQRVYFPPDVAAVGRYVQLIPTIPDRAGNQQPVSVRIRDMVLRGVWQPLSAELIHATIRLGWKPSTDGTRARRTIQQQRAAVRALASTANHAIAYRDPNGDTGYLFVEDLTQRWMSFKAGEEAEIVAILTMRTLAYDE